MLPDASAWYLKISVRLQISSVEMEWNTSYANYAECDDREGGKCIFGDGVGKGVGRVNPFFWPGKGTNCGFGSGTQVTGQCWANLTHGNVWYSFEKPGCGGLAPALACCR